MVHLNYKIMEKFLGTVILVLIASFLTFIATELKERNKLIRQFTWQYNLKASLAIYSVIATLIWLMCWAMILLVG